MVLYNDDASIFEEEPDFTCADATERCGQLITEKVPHKNAEYVALSRTYTQEELTSPGQTDPCCYKGWPLAAYWPVYVANFRATSLEESAIYSEVSNFFAFNGLLTRMIFLGTRVTVVSDCHASFERYQKDSLLLDMLVYFVSKEDADRAIATCHHTPYYGYRLTVLPGRIPVYYDATRSMRVPCVYSPYPMERVIEDELSKHAAVSFVGRYDCGNVVVEFGSREGMLTAVKAQKRWAPQTIRVPTMKQRFIEDKAKKDIRLAMASVYSFMDMKPNAVVLRWLLEGFRPYVNLDWMGPTTPVMTNANVDYLQKELASRTMDTDPDETDESDTEVTVAIERFEAAAMAEAGNRIKEEDDEYDEV